MRKEGEGQPSPTPMEEEDIVEITVTRIGRDIFKVVAKSRSDEEAEEVPRAHLMRHLALRLPDLEIDYEH